MARRRQPPPPSIDGLDVPPELLDPDADVWHNRAAHERYMAERGWDLDVRDRFHGSHTGAHPANRRGAAAEGWAIDHGVTHEPDGAFADWYRLRAMGLIA